MQNKFDFDLFVIGGGSGGVRTARWSANLGAKVGICEEDRYGGTCVIRGCIPKKLMVYASEFSHEEEGSGPYGWTTKDTSFSWGQLKRSIDQEVERLSQIYQNLLTNKNVEVFFERGKILDQHTLLVGSKKITAKNIIISSGSKPTTINIPGKEHILLSQDVFNMEELPPRMLVVGGGYIAVEFAGIFNGLGSKTTLAIRKKYVLRGFDQGLRKFLQEEMIKKGIDIKTETTIEKIEKKEKSFLVHTNTNEVLECDAVVYAIGRVPYTTGLGLEKAGIKVNEKGGIIVNNYFQTSIDNIYAIGDCIDKVYLTPVATTQGTFLSEYLYNKKDFKMEYKNIPSAVFSQPPLATVGLSEEDALEKGLVVDIYESSFRPLKHTLTGLSEKTFMKLVVDNKTQKILGAHAVGKDSAEIMQGIAIALKCGATKQDFDGTIGIHPTSAEEFVTMRTKKG